MQCSRIGGGESRVKNFNIQISDIKDLTLDDSNENKCGGIELKDNHILEKEMAMHSGILPGKSHGQRSLAGYSPWSHKESDMTYRLKQQTAIGNCRINFKVYFSIM